MSKPDINNSVWREAQEWGDGAQPSFFASRAKRRFDPNAAKGGSSAEFVDSVLTVYLTWGLPGWSDDPFASLRVIYQRPDGKWVAPIIYEMARGPDDYGTEIPVVLPVPDGTWVGIVLQSGIGVRTDVAVVRYQGRFAPLPIEPEEEENMSVPSTKLKQVVIVLEGDASNSLTGKAPISTQPITVTMVEVQVITGSARRSAEVVLMAAGAEIARFWTETGRDFYSVPIYPGVEIESSDLARVTVRFRGEVRLEAMYRGYVRV